MAGRHRKKASWKVPAGLGVSVATALVLPVWLTSGAFTSEVSGTAQAGAQPKEAPAALALTPPSPTNTTPSTTTPPPSTTPTSDAPKTTTPKPPEPQSCGTTLAGVKPHVAQVGNHLKQMFDVDNVGGRAGRAGASDHPAGLALDFMVNTSTGNTLAEYVLANKKAFGVSYVIWRQRYNDGSGWSAMEDRGGATANHFDHVHISFKSGAKVSVTC